MAPPEVVSTRPCPPVPAVKERPILFSAPMVRALLDGSKTQTRRVSGLEVINADPDRYEFRGITSGPGMPHFAFHDRETGAQVLVRCPQGQPGDRLWVREAWATHIFLNNVLPSQLRTPSVHHLADGKIQTGKGRPSIHMPRKYSRIDLEVTAVRVERLQDISEDDAIAEGIEKTSSGFWSLYGQADVDGTFSPRASYRALWESINGAGSWDANPWVWVVAFRRIRP